MIIVISPSKTLDYETSISTENYSLPPLLDYSKKLMESCKSLTVSDIENLMKISPKLAELNFERFQQWQPKPTIKNARQAILAFKGDVYEGLAVEDFSNDDFQFAQQHLKILSGLYGVLRPLDLMLPYRLEMGIKLKNGNNDNIYQFWGNTITDLLNKDVSKDMPLINLSSNEYFKVINCKQLKTHVIQPIFLDESKGQYKVISFYAKKARGLMSHYIIKNKINDHNKLKSFNLEGYQFDQQSSSDSQLIFKRSEKAAITAKSQR